MFKTAKMSIFIMLVVVIAATSLFGCAGGGGGTGGGDYPPTSSPTVSPTTSPTVSPTVTPTSSPTITPSPSPTATPTETGSMSGTVKDSYGGPIVSASVQIAGPYTYVGKRLTTTTTTDEYGDFMFEDIATGNWDVWVSKPGYTQIHLTGVKVVANQTVEIPEDETVLTPSTPVPDGYLDLSTTPSGASIEIDGSDSGLVTPWTFSLSPGSHTYRVSLDGYNPFEETITIVSGGTVTRTITLTPTPPPGNKVTITVTDDLTGSTLNDVEVYIDNEYIEKTDMNGQLVTYVESGDHRFDFIKDGYKVRVLYEPISGDTTLNITMEEE